jgi:hypothetical protein
VFAPVALAGTSTVPDLCLRDVVAIRSCASLALRMLRLVRSPDIRADRCADMSEVSRPAFRSGPLSGRLIQVLVTSGC